MDPTIVTLIAIVILLGLMAARVPVAFCMAIAGVIGLAMAGVPKLGFDALAQQLHSAPFNFILVAIPLFVLMAQVILESGLGAELFKAAEALLARFPGGLAMAAQGAGTAFAAVTGLSIASCATIGPVAIKEMVERKYSKVLAAGVIVSAGGLAVVIPPSVALLLYGYIAEVSVVKLFAAGLIPGLMIAGLDAATLVVWAIKNPKSAPRPEPLPFSKMVFTSLRGLPVLALAVMMLTFIYTGVTGVTEAAAVGTVGAFVLAIAYRKISLKKLKTMFLNTASTGGFYLMILVGALTFGYMLSYLRVPISFTEFIVGLGLSKWAVLAVIYVLLLIMGCFLDGTSIMLMVVPVLIVPLRQLGFDPIWLGVVIVILIEIGFTTPPFGINLFVVQGVAKQYGVTYSDCVKGGLPFLIADLSVVILMTIFPALALWLPEVMG